MSTILREKRQHREHFLPESEIHLQTHSFTTSVDPAQLDRYDLRLYTSKELYEMENLPAEEIRLSEVQRLSVKLSLG